MAVLSINKKKILIFISLTAVLVPAAIAGAPSELDYKVKAGFIYNFAIFVEWPQSAFAGPEAPITVCVTRPDKIGDSFDTLKDKTVKGRKILLADGKGNQGTRGCHILFINSDDKKSVRKILRGLNNKSVLTIGEMEGFAEMGGVINIRKANGKTRLEINVAAARRAGLKLSSRLLKLKRTRIIEDGQ